MDPVTVVDVLLVGGALLGYALLSRRLAGSPFTPAIVFVVVGIVVGSGVLDLLRLPVGSGELRLLAETTLGPGDERTAVVKGTGVAPALASRTRCRSSGRERSMVTRAVPEAGSDPCTSPWTKVPSPRGSVSDTLTVADGVPPISST